MAFEMVLVVRGNEKHKHSSLMERMFRLRYEHFVKRRNWPLGSRNGLETDRYDDDHATYFLSFGDEGEIVGSARVNPSTRGSLLADLFPHLVETGEAPRAADLWEGTRFIVEPRLRTRDLHRRVKAEVLSALAEWCLDQGGRHFQAVIEANMLASFVDMSLATRPLGLAKEYGGGLRAYGGGRCLAFRWDLTPELLADLHAYGRIETGLPASDALRAAVH